MPSEPLRSTLRSIVRHLAATLEAVDFEPHVTIFSALSNDVEALGVARLIAKRFAPIELIPRGLGHTQEYTKTLFVQFEQSAVLREMYETAASACSRRSNYALNPHLSLLYKKLRAAEQEELCRTLDAPMGGYRFDRIRMVETELPIRDDGPIRRWRTACDLALGQS